MKRLVFFLVLSILCLVLALAGCGNIFIRGALPATSSTVSGSVSVVQLSAVIGENGTTVQVTFVTLLQSGVSSTVGFCGDQRSQFPMQQIIRAEFTQGTPCDSIITIVII
jgi:hypothetical protein